ncbi:hypothetical protein KCU64_g64, partial [Aureobasidium melanogenum]
LSSLTSDQNSTRDIIRSSRLVMERCKVSAFSGGKLAITISLISSGRNNNGELGADEASCYEKEISTTEGCCYYSSASSTYATIRD